VVISSDADRALRWVAALATLGAATFLVASSYDEDSGPVRALRADGYSILALYFTVVVIGAVAQTPLAVRRRARVGVGWLAVLGFVGYGVVLVCLTLGPALLSATGVIFAGGSAGGPLAGGHWLRRARQRRAAGRVANPLVGVAAVLYLPGIVLLALLGAMSLARTPVGAALVPRGGAGFLISAAIGTGAVVGLAVMVAVLVRLRGRAPADAARPVPAAGDRFRPHHLVGIVAYLVAGGLLGAQLGRFLPGGVVSVLAFGWLITAVPLLGFLVETARRWRSAAR